VNRLLITAFAFAIFLTSNVTSVVPVFAQTSKKQESAADRIARATKKINGKQKYLLAYRLKPGDELRWDFEQVVSTKFQMAGFTEESSSRSKNRKLWKVANVDELGNMTFSYTVESIEMWTKSGDGEPIAYNSLSDDEIPELYTLAAEGVGQTQAIFSISPDGQILDRKSNHKSSDLGLGKLTIPLPKQAVSVGYKWNVPKVLQATDTGDRAKKGKAREVYELSKVKGQNAYISFRTEILTPNLSEKVRSVIMQKMNKGVVVFDMNRGCPVLTSVKWDEKAQGFEGPDSFLKYVGRMTEKVVVGNASNQKSQSTLTPLKENVARKPVEIKTRDSNPIMRK
jgi:hypothetical protein